MTKYKGNANSRWLGSWSWATPSLLLLLSCGPSMSSGGTGDIGGGDAGAGGDTTGSGGSSGGAGGNGGSASGGTGGSSTSADAAVGGGGTGGGAGGQAGHGGSTGGGGKDASAGGGSGGSSGSGGSGGSAAHDAAVGPTTDAGSAGEQVFAIVGDYGADNSAEANVAALIKSWNPEFVATTGDNNYGGASALDDEIGKYYASFIGDYKGSHGPGSPTNRFWPSAGNHDWDSNNLKAYTDYFTLPGKERYYEKQIGRVHLFAVDSDEREPDGNSSSSTQAKWLQAALAASTACHKIVYFHEPPYTSGTLNGQSTFMRWPFKAWGATAVITGHEHVYERLEVDGLLYIVNGLGGDSRYTFGSPVSQSKFRYASQNGAMRVVASATGITYEFWTTGKQKIESTTVPSNCP